MGRIEREHKQKTDHERWVRRTFLKIAATAMLFASSQISDYKEFRPMQIHAYDDASVMYNNCAAYYYEIQIADWVKLLAEKSHLNVEVRQNNGTLVEKTDETFITRNIFNREHNIGEAVHGTIEARMNVLDVFELSDKDTVNTHCYSKK